MTVSDFITNAALRLSAASIPSPRLDAELLVGHVFDKPRAWLIAHRDTPLNPRMASRAAALVQRRLEREPMAYILGSKEFYGREFTVTPDVLIPRPESEMLIDTVKHYIKESPLYRGGRLKIIDVGCGSGCLGITTKLELPKLDVTLSDVSPAALTVTQKNAEQLGAHVTIVHSDLFTAFLASDGDMLSGPKIQNLKSKIYYDFIIANLPYIDRTWETSPELRYEPGIALYAEEQGLGLIKTLLAQAPSVLVPGGYLLLEADPCQHKEVIEHGKWNGFEVVEVREYIVALQRE